MDTVIGQDPAPSIDEQLLTIEGQLQDIVGEKSTEPQSKKTPSSDGDNPQDQALPPLAASGPSRHRDFKRLIRPALGIGLLGLATWALVPLLIDVRSTQAIVNAPVVTLRSPIDGTVTFLCRTASGATVRANTALFKVQNALADGDRLDVLKDEQSHLAARIDGLRRQQASLVGLRDKLTATVRKYEEARLRTLEVEREEARAKVNAAAAVKKQRNSEEDQIDRLQGSRSVSTQDTVAVHSAADAAQYSLVQAQKNVENIDEQIRALRDGVHIGPGDGRNDLPYSAQRLHEIGFRIEEVGAALGQDEAKLAQLRRHISAEKKRLAGRSRFTATAPADWIVWRRHVVSGAPIKADSSLMDMIDPSEVFIDAVIHEKNLARVRPGDKARVRIAGSDKVRTAVVRQVIGRTLPWPDRLLAVESTPHDRQEVHVILSFCEPLSNGGDDAPAPIGLPAEVTFVSARGLF